MKYFRKRLFQLVPPEVILGLRQLSHRRNRATLAERGFPKRATFVTGQVTKKTVLILAPHPDDEAIGMGGTLWMHLNSQSNVTVLYMTDGRGINTKDTSLAARRRAEAEQLTLKFPFKQIFWEIADNQLTNDQATVSKLVRLITEIQPDEIYLPSFFDHQFDHFAANKILAQAIAQSGHPALTVLGYEIWDNISFPNFFVDITKHFHHKEAVLRHYAIPHEYTDFTELCRKRNGLHYLLNVRSKISNPPGYAEAFLRLDSNSYTELFSSYCEALDEIASELPARIQSG